MFTKFYRSVLLVLLTPLLVACETLEGERGTSPLPPSIGPVTVNGTMWANEPLSVYFSDHVTQSESASTVAMNDLYFANPYAFQVQLRYQFPAVGLEIKENGVTLPVMQARTNTKSRPSKVAQVDVIDPVTGQVKIRAGTVTEWDWPLPSNMRQRGVPPTHKSSYSIEMINTCGNQLNSSVGLCSNPSAIMLLTISPPRQPVNPIHGQMFEYTLIEKGSGGYASNTASTLIKAIFIQPGKCQIRSLILQPTTGKAGDLATADFEATDCRRVTLNVSSEQNPLFDRVALIYAENVIESRKFLLPRMLSVNAKLMAFDSMQRFVSRTESVQIDPCSISATHSQCPVNCTAMPNDSRCPANCTANPSDPRCVSACPRTTDNPNGEIRAWKTGMYCNFNTYPITIYGCTFAEAEQARPPNPGCVYTTITGTPVGECVSGIPKQNFDMCLSCTTQGSTTPILESALVRDMCTLDQAKQSAIDSRKPRSCEFVSAGHCP